VETALAGLDDVCAYKRCVCVHTRPYAAYRCVCPGCYTHMLLEYELL
jgi:hypothetical protein